MQPIHELLSRIRWDREFARGEFALGYYDRVAGRVQVVAFSTVNFDPDKPGSFTLFDAEGAAHHIPLHRVRAVYKNGRVIWQRPGGTPSGGAS
jgi:uncharacterized protein (UPF0248 family)